MKDRFMPLRKRIDEISSSIKDEKMKKMFNNCFFSTLDTTTKKLPDGGYYVFTGDIPAMWLRDSSAQVMHYLEVAGGDKEVQELIKGLVQCQCKYILIDPYANAFNETANGAGHKDKTNFASDWIWERKFEVDSLCYCVWLACKYFYNTGDKTVFDGLFVKAMEKIIEVFEIEQNHDEKSDYYFVREGEFAFDTLDNDGKGSPTKPCGLIWSAFRPSDDRCKYHYLIPSNQFAVVVMDYLVDIFTNVVPNADLAKRADRLSKTVSEAIKKYAVVKHEKFGDIYAYETDGFGNYLFMDDANVPSLLSLPYLGFTTLDDKIYQNTRRFILSEENPYFYSGTFACGIGSPHTPEGYIWHIALVMQMLTTDSADEWADCLKKVLATDGGKEVMHESFDSCDPKKYTRDWFAWANSLFATAIIKKYNNPQK